MVLVLEREEEEGVEKLPIAEVKTVGTGWHVTGGP
jgi:hypothetical protein